LADQFLGLQPFYQRANLRSSLVFVGLMPSTAIGSSILKHTTATRHSVNVAVPHVHPTRPVPLKHAPDLAKHSNQLSHELVE
jgi:hypothetical protein